MQTKRTLTLKSPAFKDGGEIPLKYSCDGKNKYPPLAIAGVPSGAKSLVLIVDDPDAENGIWVHWIMWNIPPSTALIEEDFIPSGVLGVNSKGEIGYQCPCPPSGTHRYMFKMYALDTMLGLPEGRSKRELEEVMRGHIMENTTLVGLYSRG